MNVKSGLYVAVMGALGDILTLFAIPVGPNIHINLYVLPAVLVGSTTGWLLGGLAGAIGALYTIVLWGHPYSIIYGFLLGALTGIFCQKFGLRPIISGIIAHIITLPWLYFSLVNILGLAIPIFYLGMFTMAVQLVVSLLITEGIIAVPALKKRIPQVPIASRAAGFLRHPWSAGS
ncbi:MAG: hypothetical protein NUV93_03295 [Firmicutes bacterium]|jgi:hypothetical protein|nr:hypothetical protein [Bacillota bacterium]